MTIIYDSTTKATLPRTFGSGILPWVPLHHADHTAADEAWAAEHLNGEAIDWDAEGEWVEARELIEAGYCYL